MRRTSAVVRAWDGPNSRVAFELDLDQMPWGPFEALGKRVTLLIPEPGNDGGGARDETESKLERALRHVEHAAAKCAEFAELGNSDQLWRTSLETWEWLRDFLTAAWIEGEGNGARREGAERDVTVEAGPGTPPDLPDMPGAAATLEVAATALRNTPLAVWREAVGTYNPEAPTREEAIRTLQGVARLLAAAVGHGESRPTDTGTRAPGEAEDSRDRRDAGPAGPAPSSSATEGSEGRTPTEDDLSFDYAAGYDEGYRMGRRVGRALAARQRGARGG